MATADSVVNFFNKRWLVAIVVAVVLYGLVRRFV
jgi:hypothetical protein